MATAATTNFRAEDRTSLFIMAQLHCGGASRPVKLRNISPTGALIEGEGIPAVGSHAELRRGAQSATGTVVWRDPGLAGKAGIHFDRPTDVELWLPTAAMQRSVDFAVEGMRAAEPVAAGRAPLHASTISTEDMESVALMLDDLADALSHDAGVLFNYAMKLQALDIGAQMLRKLAFQARRGGIS